MLLHMSWLVAPNALPPHWKAHDQVDRGCSRGVAALGSRYVDELRLLCLSISFKAQVALGYPILPCLESGACVITLPGSTPTAQHIAA
jgi:hypothetical protein